MGMHILIVGNPSDGYKHYGPFTTSGDAVDAGDRLMTGDWWVVPLEAIPTEDAELSK